MLYALYVLLCILVGYLGRKREIGFAGFFILSLLLSPLITALILLISGQRKTAASCVQFAEAGCDDER